MYRFFTIGSGSWGLVLSKILCENGHKVKVFLRSEEKLRRLESERIEKNIEIPKEIEFTLDLESSKDYDFIIIAVPSFAFSQTLKSIDFLKNKLFLIGTKGLTPELKFKSEIFEEIMGNRNFAIISGPNIAIELSRKKPASSVIVSYNYEIAKLFQEILFNDYFRPYIWDDVIGVEIGGSLKNIYAIASGIVDALNLGLNAKSSLLTRALSEMVRFGVAFGARKRTFSGLSGIGDLITTSFSKDSRNYFVGYMLGLGYKLSYIKEELKEKNMVAEGIDTTILVNEISKNKNIDMPIAKIVKKILLEEIDVKEGIGLLVKRPLKKEFE
ncbi:MAG: NAD(P)-dependent glycerol-3-phosphate dehydrogenase [candidate division WOR-3 bacterium]|nr:NAD(P)-dependent glycerol-3-phosphate dehydrogenase [candidate division WOR-3 bacterium]MCX7947897.1 NAD(P)-dependent glycerol-3-phosphate dehydrogenase [candidate division WOR-3 bacterium]MDW8150719.1 NAD(P)H-dependent glycerol-3-phosphate dehydrogenase [candidate division WOR-3 bacterium]